MRRTTLALAAVLLTATACGSSDTDPGAAARSSAGPSPTATSDPLEDPGQQDLLAKIGVGAPPEDLTWRYAAPPRSWRRIGTQESQGTTQWQVGTTRCGVSLSQPSGVGTATSPTSDDVVDKAVTDLAATIPGTPQPEVTEHGYRMLANDVTGLDGSAQVKVATRTVSFGSGIEGSFLGYRNGDFALQLSAVCGQGAYGSRAAEIERFVRRLAARTTY